MTDLRRALFEPRSVALYGASDNPSKTSSRPLQYLRQSGWGGRIYPINPFRTSVLGEQCWPGLADLPEVPDHVYILTDSESALEAIRECAELGVPVVSVIANGFNSSDPEGHRRVEAIRGILAQSSTRLLGPSTLGIATPRTGFCLTGNAAFAEGGGGHGGVFVASQSGSLIGALLSRGRAGGIGFAGLVSSGNEIDLSLGEICELTLSDPHVSSYALFMESLVGAESLKSFATRASELGKSILVYKLGRSRAGAELSVGHTGAVAGDDAVATAFFREYGMGRVTNLDALLEGQNLGRRLASRAPTEPLKTIVMTTTGGGGAMVVDQLGVSGATLGTPSEQLCSALAKEGIEAGPSALIDLELSGANYDTVKTAIRLLSESKEFDVIVAVAGSSARNHPELVVQPIADSANLDTPIAAFIVPEAPEAHVLLQEAGISAFRTPEACADAIGAVGSRAFTRRTEPVYRQAKAVDVLDEASSYRVLERQGIRFAEFRVFGVDEEFEFPGFPGPYVVKAVSRQLPHKSEAGAVVVGVEDWQELAAVRDRIVASVASFSSSVAIEGILVQRMVDALAEVLLGYRVDPDVGPVVIVGAGGIATELGDGAAVGLAPISETQALKMIDEVNVFTLFRGYRSRPVGDVDALVSAIVSLSELALRAPDVVEAEINPLLVLREGEGVCAVDALVSMRVDGGVGA